MSGYPLKTTPEERISKSKREHMEAVLGLWEGGKHGVCLGVPVAEFLRLEGETSLYLRVDSLARGGSPLVALKVY